mmetsp:Transcript_30968/g.62981  ORF Transcript_30968/g.62981 Transcript_30968/m.62981 type:complete len:767 (-) Transcript_30968:15-2315(-)
MAIRLEEGLLHGIPSGLRSPIPRVVPGRDPHRDVVRIVRISVDRESGFVVAVQAVLPPLFGSEGEQKRLVEETEAAFPQGIRHGFDFGGEMKSHFGGVVVFPQAAHLPVDVSDVVFQSAVEFVADVSGEGGEGRGVDPEAELIFVEVDDDAFGAEVLERVGQVSFVDAAEEGHGCAEDGYEEVRQDGYVGVGPFHGEEEAEEYFAAGGEEGQLGGGDEDLSFEGECRPDGEYVGYVEALEEVGEGEGDPGDGHVVRRTPDGDDAVEDGGLDLEGPRRRGGEFGAEVGDVSFYGEREGGFGGVGVGIENDFVGRGGRVIVGRRRFGQSVQLGQILSEGHEVRMHGENDEALGKVDDLLSHVSRWGGCGCGCGCRWWLGLCFVCDFVCDFGLGFGLGFGGREEKVVFVVDRRFHGSFGSGGGSGFGCGCGRGVVRVRDVRCLSRRHLRLRLRRHDNLHLDLDLDLVGLPHGQTRAVHALPLLAGGDEVVHLGHGRADAALAADQRDGAGGKAKGRDAVGQQRVFLVVLERVARRDLRLEFRDVDGGIVGGGVVGVLARLRHGLGGSSLRPRAHHAEILHQSRHLFPGPRFAQLRDPPSRVGRSAGVVAVIAVAVIADAAVRAGPTAIGMGMSAPVEAARVAAQVRQVRTVEIRGTAAPIPAKAATPAVLEGQAGHQLEVAHGVAAHVLVVDAMAQVPVAVAVTVAVVIIVVVVVVVRCGAGGQVDGLVGALALFAVALHWFRWPVSEDGVMTIWRMMMMANKECCCWL